MWRLVVVRQYSSKHEDVLDGEHGDDRHDQRAHLSPSDRQQHGLASRRRGVQTPQFCHLSIRSDHFTKVQDLRIVQ